jgi:V/A-type H+-transporting ATPase subunit E
MNGLDKITEEIVSEAEAEAAKIAADARAQADRIIAEAKAQASKEANGIKADSDKSVAGLNEQRESMFGLQRRQAMLQARQTALDEALNAAHTYLLNLPDIEYFTLCIRLAVSQSEDGAGELLFNERDLHRLPESFAHLLNIAMPEGRTLEVSSVTAPIDGGFVIKYGDLQENCSFSAIFRERHDEFVDLIREPLFEE